MFNLKGNNQSVLLHNVSLAILIVILVLVMPDLHFKSSIFSFFVGMLPSLIFSVFMVWDKLQPCISSFILNKFPVKEKNIQIVTLLILPFLSMIFLYLLTYMAELSYMISKYDDGQFNEDDALYFLISLWGSYLSSFIISFIRGSVK